MPLLTGSAAWQTAKTSLHGHRLQTVRVNRRASTLSSIHNGIQRSRAFGPPERPLPRAPPKLTFKERKKFLEEAGDYKIRKGRKNIREPVIRKALSKKARFYSPDYRHGKHSLVYEAHVGKYKPLFDQIKAEEAEQRAALLDLGKGPPRPTSGRERGRMGRAADTRRDVRKEIQRSDFFPELESGQSASGRRSGGADVRLASARDRRRTGEDMRRSDLDGIPRGEVQTSKRPDRRAQVFGRGFETDHLSTRAGDSDFPPGRATREWKQPSRINEQTSIPYTTAASQFLYGKSVVQAALQSARRQLYKLYVQDSDPGEGIEVMARRKDIEIIYMDRNNERDNRLMDRMSEDRPHNGYILEASPIPQLPLLGLGKFSGDPTTNTYGYDIVRGHQSAEEEAINGTPDFVRITSPTHRPFVILLEEVLDPGNLGAILRTASFLGVDAVVMTKRSSASLTAVALKSAAGAAETLTLFSVVHSLQFLQKSRIYGWKVYSSTSHPRGSKKGLEYSNTLEVERNDPLKSSPCVLVLGNEGFGISETVLRRGSDYGVYIPNRSGGTAVDSLNVSVAAGLLSTAFLKGRARAEYEALEGKLDRKKDKLF